MKLRARATGILVAKALNLDATLKKATALTGKQSTGGESGNQSGQGGNPSGPDTNSPDDGE